MSNLARDVREKHDRWLTHDLDDYYGHDDEDSFNLCPQCEEPFKEWNGEVWCDNEACPECPDHDPTCCYDCKHHLKQDENGKYYWEHELCEKCREEEFNEIINNG